MVFVKPTPLTWSTVRLVQRSGLVMGHLSLIYMQIFMYPFFKPAFLPSVDANPFFSVNDLSCKVGIDILFIVLFWVVHSTMPRTWFKTLMNRLLNNQYYYYQKGIYALISGIQMFQVFFFWQPLNHVLVPDHDSQFLRVISYITIALGFYMWQQSLYDLSDDDVFGSQQLNRFKREGQEMPTPFILKKLSRLGLSCRHPLYTGMILMFCGPLLHDAVTVGRLILAIQFSLGIIVGSRFEERQFSREDNKTFEKFRTINPNQFIPDLSILFGSEAKINDLKQKMIKLGS